MLNLAAETLLPNDDPRPGFYNACCKAEFDDIIATDRQKSAEDAWEDLKKEYKQLKLRFKQQALGQNLKQALGQNQQALGQNLKCAIQSLTYPGKGH